MVGSSTDKSIITEAMFWPELMGEQKLKADSIHEFSGASLKTLGRLTGSHSKNQHLPRWRHLAAAHFRQARVNPES